MTEYNSWNGNRYINKNNHLKMRLGTSVVSDISSNSSSITSSTLTPWKCYSIDIDCDGPPLSSGPLKSIHDDYTTSTLPSRGSNKKKNLISKSFQTKAATVEEHKNDSITNYLRDKVGISGGRNLHEPLNIKPINLISRDKLINGSNEIIKNEKNSIASKINNIIPLNGLQKKITSPKKQWFSTSIDEIEGNSYHKNHSSIKPFTLDSVSQYIDDDVTPEYNEKNIINSNDTIKKNFLEFSTTKNSYKDVYENKKDNNMRYNEKNNNMDKCNIKEINKNVNDYKINEENVLKNYKSIDEINITRGGIKNLIKEYSQKQDDVDKSSMVNERVPFTIKRLSNNKNVYNDINENKIVSDTLLPLSSTTTTITNNNNNNNTTIYSEISTTTTFGKKDLINDCNNNTINNIHTKTTFGKNVPSNEDDTLMSVDDAYNILGLTRKSSLVVRTQTSLRVKIMIEKLLYSSGRDQRRALFALKKVFQDDKDLVPEFVQSEGLDSLIKLGRISDQNHQNYILRALGQIMLYVDGMNGIIAHNDTIKWFYELLDSPLMNEEERREMSPLRLEWYRLVVKTALKLLLVFVEYTDSNSLLLLASVTAVDRENNRQPWYSIMRILRERNATDEETLVYGMTVINKTLDGIPDQDTYYDIVDSLEVQGIEECLKAMNSIANKELQDQVALYEKVLKQEDAANDESDSSDGLVVKMRHSQINNGNYDRSSFRRDKQAINNNGINIEKETKKFSENISKFENEAQKLMKGDWIKDDKNDNDKNSIPKNNYVMKNNYERNDINKNGVIPPNNNNNNLDGKENCRNEITKNEIKHDEPPVVIEDEEPKVKAPPPSFPSMLFSPTEKVSMEFPETVDNKKEEPTIKPMMKTRHDDEEDGVSNNFAAQLRKRAQMREENSTRSGLFESKQSESEINWKKAAENLKHKPLIINDLDFSEFHDDQFEQDPLVLARMAQNNIRNENLLSGGPPPPPPPNMIKGIPPAPPNIPPPLSFGKKDGRESSPPSSKAALVKMHWKEVVAEPPPVPTLKNKGTFWKKVETPQIDTSKLAKLFEMKQEKQILKKANGEVKPQVLQVLSMKRSQAINIGLTKLPPINAIPAAIMKFDSLVLNKEGIEKILQTMMPTVAEIELIQNKMAENPDMPLGHAEQFLLKLYQIPCLLERLKLWLFTLDYKNCEKDIAEPLMDLQLAMKEIEYSKTFRTAMGMLLTIGNALNGTEIQGFQLDYLTKASEVKDPVYKHTLTYHLAEYMIDTYSDGTDLYSEFGAVARSARIDYEELHENLKKLEQDCKASWDYLNKISQKESTHSMKQKIDEYLSDVAKRIHQLKNIYRLTINRWHAFLLFFGYTVQDIPNQKPMTVCKMVIEFALEYRTTRDKILQQRKRLADKRERNKTRGKMWALEKQNNQENSSNVGRRRQFVQNDSDRHDEMAKMLTGGDDSLNRRRIRPTPERTAEQTIIAKREALRSTPGPNGGETNDGDDEILDGLVKAATIQSEPRDNRRKARQFNRKSLRRTRTLKLVDDQLGSVLNNY
ncbi:Armadillo-like helical domain and Formin, GTPase-binding and FH3 domain and Formin, FH2 domain and Armadillo-type fold domain-containing protein [Strongyloides ratti]|uniref:Armadillo-like helical domain and Formin, GTPase-binding and FH3 domain and Formin, FH2 domain and Armadillo-type fold domain-containing protein n=1 Tax=Strongyloides ratti TaxID=34506 RepID=A0A090MX15_STRRB|nr:Armadillo-like helical domain and Formin, GTPase-binding and FH3 domain and Formin, FH2 domain and Armadillo-type fold domain-containing protein [Strongyloides ratti]CEF64644.1 Armadillo-like helical domain and Formin, GTPase-binding and FH3 domain and Formin, FH2 domain and Armadillo-type fold domain-containing protein [Strongyloides ratti]